VPVEWADVIDDAETCQVFLASGDSDMYSL
jgi:hypothetical protein